MYNQLAPVGTIFLCPVCGRRSRDRAGTQDTDQGWNASCVTNAILCDEATIKVVGGKVVQAGKSSKAALDLPWEDQSDAAK